jgi:predicted ATPase
MKLQHIEIRNVKNFTGLNNFSFDPNININTISGTNGSGKTTIFKCVQLCQKAFFLDQFNGKEENYSFLKEKLFAMAEGYLSGQDSYIKVTFLIDDKEFFFKIFIKDKELKRECDNESLINIAKYWNIHNPISIILIIDASKSFSNENIEYSNISINPYSKKELVHKCIFQPEEIFSYMYQTVVKDYIHERIIPAKPPRYFYFNIATKLMNLLMENVKISNFSANAVHDQFVVLGKTNSTSKMFDIRDFSSGEKALFFILLFICHIPSIGMLVIDEPENHFHEDLLNKFVTMLNEIAKSNNFAQWIKNNIKDINVTWLTDYYRHNLKQIFFLTHSKNLIYNNFSYGKNYIVNKGMNEITYANSENVLRQIGLSTVYSKVLFVEGKDDYNFLQNILLHIILKSNHLEIPEKSLKLLKK